jgi:endonuclease YncB( thermonuclease family)
MVTGYSNIQIAESRTRLRDIQSGIDDVWKLQKQARENEQYNTSSADLYSAARMTLMAIRADYDVLVAFVESNKSKLYGGDNGEYLYFKRMFDVIRSLLSYLEDTIVIPSLTAPIIPSGSADNQSPGASFSGHVVEVSDSDTIVVEQVTDSGESLRHVVRIAGIDAPEGGTVRGKLYAAATRAYWMNKLVTVYYDRHTPNDVYGRVLGTVYDGDSESGDNFAIWSLSRGYSAPNLKFGKNHFVDPIEIKQAASKYIPSWPHLGKVKIQSKPTHAIVRVGRNDSELSIIRGNTPIELDLPIGRHTIILTFDESGSIRDTVDVLQEETKLPIYVYGGKGTAPVVITTEPIDSRVIISVGDDVIGLSPVYIGLPVDLSVEIRAAYPDGTVLTETVVPVVGHVTKIEFKK